MNFRRHLPMYWRVTAAFVAVGVVWGSAWIPTSALSQALPGLAAGALRFGLAATVLAIAEVLLRLRAPKGKRSPVGRLLLPSAVLGVTMLGLPYALTVWAAGRVSPGLVALCFGLMPLGVLLFEGDEAGLAGQGSAITAVVLGIGGVAMLVAPGISFGWQQAVGVLALLAAMGLGGFSLIYVRGLYARGRLRDGDLLTFSAIQLGVASVLLTVLNMGSEPGTLAPSMKTAALPLALLSIGVSGGTLPLLYWMLGRMSAWRAATLQWMSTLVAVAEAAWILHARPAAEGWVGAALVPGVLLWIFLCAQRGGAGAVTLQITKHTFLPLRASDIRRK